MIKELREAMKLVHYEANDQRRYLASAHKWAEMTGRPDVQDLIIEVRLALENYLKFTEHLYEKAETIGSIEDEVSKLLKSIYQNNELSKEPSEGLKVAYEKLAELLGVDLTHHHRFKTIFVEDEIKEICSCGVEENNETKT